MEPPPKTNFLQSARDKLQAVVRGETRALALEWLALCIRSRNSALTRRLNLVKTERAHGVLRSKEP